MQHDASHACCMQVCQTLERLPDERYIFMKLTYTEDTPHDYEPTGFRAYTNVDADHFSQRPFTMCGTPPPTPATHVTCNAPACRAPCAACMQGGLSCMHAPNMLRRRCAGVRKR